MLKRINDANCLLSHLTGPENDGWRKPTAAKFKLEPGVNEIKVLADRLDITKSVRSGANTLETKPFRLKNPRVIRLPAASSSNSKTF